MLKECPVCAAPLVNLSSQRLRLCSNGRCGHQQAWDLNSGQQPLIANSRLKNKTSYCAKAVAFVL